MLFRRGQLDEAREELERAAALPGGVDDPAVWDHLGDVYFRLEEKAKAAGGVAEVAGAVRARPSAATDERYEGMKKKLKLLEP